MKQYFKLPGYYEGLLGRRITHSGRLWLVRVVNDLPYYYFVMIRGFHLGRDGASGGQSIGVWRFIEEPDAIEKFLELLPLYPPPVVKQPTDAQLAAREAFKTRMKNPEPPQEGGDRRQGPSGQPS